MTTAQTTVKADLDIARQLAGWGVPIFLAQPDRDQLGQWRPDGGHGKTGYWLPTRWQRTVPDPAVVDKWKPGMALCAVMGRAVDLLDSDPRHGGDVSRQELMDAGSWPTIWWQASTPSDGLHDFVSLWAWARWTTSDLAWMSRLAETGKGMGSPSSLRP